MPPLTIKKIPEALYDKLKESAQRHRRSINDEAIACLEQVLMPVPRDAEALIREAEALNRRTSITFDEKLIEQGKREGRV